jgi:hypothetical protein
MIARTSIAILLVTASARLDAAVAQIASPAHNESVGSGEILGCWTKLDTGPEDRDYWSLCFQGNGKVDSAVIAGSPATGLGGTASSGLYEIAEGQIKFSFDAGDYGWLWESGLVLCNFALQENRLAFTQCEGNARDVNFERTSTSVE